MPAQRGKQYFDQGKFAEAETYFRRAVEQRCGGAQALADRINLAATLRERNSIDEARDVLLAVKDAGAHPAEMAISYWNCLALIEEQSGRTAAAEAAYRKAVALLLPLGPSRLSRQVWTNFARQRLRQGRIREAEEAMQRVQEQPGWQHDRPLAFDLNLAELRRLQGRSAEAEAILRRLFDDGSGVPLQMRGAIANNLASLAANRGAHREAERLWQSANTLLREAYGASHPSVAKGLNNLAAHYVSRRRYAEAEAMYREAIAMQEDPMLLNNLATLLQIRERMPEAEELYRRAILLYERKAKPSRDAIQLYGNHALLLMEMRRPEEALTNFRTVVGLLPLAVPADEPMLARYLDLYERVLRRRREPVEAERVAMMAMRYRVRSALRADN